MALYQNDREQVAEALDHVAEAAAVLNSIDLRSYRADGATKADLWSARAHVAELYDALARLTR